MNARGFLADPAALGTEHEAWSNGGGRLDVTTYFGTTYTRTMS